jgi:hypothetical protein
VASVFTLDDLERAGEQALATWRQGIDRDWSVPAGTLEWSCYDTAAHAVDCTFAPALFLASGRQHAYPQLADCMPTPTATMADQIDNLRTALTVLLAVLRTADPSSRAIIRRHPEPQVAGPVDFAPRGALELVVHTYDIASGLRLPYQLPAGPAERLGAHTANWPGRVAFEPTGDPWTDLLLANGRPPGATP